MKKYGAMKHEEPMAEEKFLKKPCVWDTRVEYKSASSIWFTSRFRIGGDSRKLGLWAENEPKTAVKTGRKWNLTQTH